MVTLKDVASAADVSVSTVSYVLNGKKKVTEETHGRIMDAVKRLGYVPNKSAVSLKTNISHTIGVLVPHFASVFFVEMVQAIENVAHQNGYSVILSISHEEKQRERTCLKNLLGEQIDGLLLAANDPDDDPIQGAIGIPVVKLFPSKQPDDYFVSSVSFDGGYLAGKYLTGRGLRKVAVLAYAPELQTVRDRIDGFFAAQQALGVNIRRDLLINQRSCTFHDGYEACLEMIRRGEKVDAVFAVNDVMAMGAVRALRERGTRVPEDVAVLGYDNIELSQMGYPALTTIDIHGELSARLAAEVLIKLMRGESVEQRQVAIPPKLIVRESA